MPALLPRLSVLGAAVVLLIGCGSSDEGGTEAGVSQPEASRNERPQPVKPRHHLHITLNSRPGPENSAILLADQRGYFADVGLKMLITYPQSPALPITYTANGATDVVVTQEPELVLARDEGLPVVAFGSLVPHPTMAMIWPKGSGIDSLADLKGKTIAYPGVAVQKDLLASLLETADLELADVKLDGVGYDLTQALESGRADAIFGGSETVEGVSLEASGLDPVVTPIAAAGAPGYDELVFVTRPGLLATDPTLSRRVLKAVSRGVAAVKEDPAAGRRAVAESELEPAALKDMGAGVAATAPLLSGTGYIDPERLSGLVEWMYAQGIIESEVPVSQLVAGDREATDPGQAQE